jgi:hypothetical protein
MKWPGIGYRRNKIIMRRWLTVTFMVLVSAATHAADEEPVCKFLLRQIGFSAQRADSAENDYFEKAKYLKKIATMSQSALQSAYPSSAWVFESELARANQSLDAAETRRQLAFSAVNIATMAYVQQCPQHFAAIQGDYLQLAFLVGKAMSDSTQEEPSK